MVAQAVKEQRLDRKARTAVTIAALMFLAVPLFLITRLVMGIAIEPPSQVFRTGDDQLVMLRDGSTILVKNSSARRIADWFRLDRKGEERFEVGNANFAPGASTLTNDGWEHLVQFAHILKAHPGVEAVVLFSAHKGDPASVALEHQRADRISAEVQKQGVTADQIAVAPEAFKAGHNGAADEGLEVVLVNHG